MTSTIPDSFGASPASVKWTVVRGDTARLRVEFLNSDEVTMYDTSTWTFISTAYDPKSDTSYTLNTVANNGFVDISVSPAVTATWGNGSKPMSAELSFDLQVTIDNDTVWTPILGTINVLSDVTPGGV